MKTVERYEGFDEAFQKRDLLRERGVYACCSGKPGAVELLVMSSLAARAQMILQQQRGMGGLDPYGIDTSGVQVGNAPIPAGTYQAALDQLPLNPGQSLTDMITASLQETPAAGKDTTMTWLPWVAGGLFLILFLPLLASTRGH